MRLVVLMIMLFEKRLACFTLYCFEVTIKPKHSPVIFPAKEDECLDSGSGLNY
jgi:hypothetical protein